MLICIVLKIINCYFGWSMLIFLWSFEFLVFNLMAYNWSLVADFFLWQIMEFMAINRWNSSGKDVNSQLKINGIWIAKF